MFILGLIIHLKTNRSPNLTCMFMVVYSSKKKEESVFNMRGQVVFSVDYL